jgi:hypothetical protein
MRMLCSFTPRAATRNPPQKQMAEASMALRGPTLSTHFPPKAADKPRQTMARLKIHPRVVSFQSSGAGRVMPISLVIGRLKTLNA